MINKRIKDRTNVRYGKLVALEFTGEVKPPGGARWKCQCDCGNIVEATSFALQVGHKKSCGCLIKDIGVAKRLPKGEHGFRRIMKDMKRRCLENNRDYNISDEDMFNMSQANCFYCDTPPRSVSKISHKIKNISEAAVQNSAFTYNGLDRLDNNLGYIYGNVVTCCQVCNKIRNKFLTSEEMIEVIKLIKTIRNKKYIWD